MLSEQEGKVCQSCIERGFNPPNLATREFNPNEFLCEDCFQAVLSNLTSIGPAELSKTEVRKVIEDNPPGPFLEHVYNLLNVPAELRYDSVDTTCRQYDKIFNFHAPSVLNYGSIEELSNEIEQRAMALFHIKYSIEPLELKIKQLKDKARQERQLKGLSDSKEDYAKEKKPSSKIKQTQEEKMARALGMSVDNYRVMIRKAKETEFNKLVGNEVGTTLSSEDSQLAGNKPEVIPGSKEAKVKSSEVVIKRRF